MRYTLRFCSGAYIYENIQLKDHAEVFVKLCYLKDGLEILL